MAISLRAAGSYVDTASSTTLTVTLPTHSAGDMLILRVACKAYNTSIDCNTTGWNPVGNAYANGSTANGNGVGSVNHRAFYKVATSASETNPVVTFGTTPSPGMAVALSYQKASTEDWVAPVGAGGGDATLRTSQTCTISSHISVIAGDMVDFFLAWGDNYASTSPTITQTGVTYGTVSEQPATALSTATGNDGAMDGGYRLASSGTSSAAAVVTATFGNSEQGGAWQTRLRVTPVITLGLIDGSNALYAPTVVNMLQFVTLPLLEQLGGIVRGSSFASDTLDSWSAFTGNVNWEYNATYTSTSGKGVISSSTSSYHAGFRHLASPTSKADVDIVLVANVLGQASTDEGQGVCYRYVSASGGYYFALVKRASSHPLTSVDVRLFRIAYNAGFLGAVQIGSATDIDITAYTNNHVLRVAAIGDKHYVKVWKEGDSEPTSWNIEVTDSTYSAAGKVGLLDLTNGDYSSEFHDLVAYEASAGSAAPVLYAPTLAPKNTLTLGLLDGGPTLYAPSLSQAAGSQTITLGLIDGENALYAPTLLPQPVTVTLGAIENTPTLYAPTLLATNTLTLGLIDGANALYAPTLVGKNTLTLGLIDGAAALYAPTLVPKNALALGLIDGANALYAPALTLAPYPIVLGLLDGAATLYAPTVAQAGGAPQDVTLGLLDGAGTLYDPTVIPGPITVTLGLLDAGPALYAPAVQPDQFVTLGLLDAGAALYAPQLEPEEWVFTLPLIDGSNALYAPTLTLAPYPITLGLLDNGAALYAPTVTGGSQNIVLGLLDGEPALYAPSVVPDQFLTLDLLDGANALYQPVISPAAVTLGLALLDAGAQLYQPTLAPISTIALGLLDANPELYAPALAGSATTITLTLLDGAATLYAPTVVGLLDQAIALGLLDGSGALYAPTVANASVVIAGYTRTCDGAILPFATIDVFRSSDNAWVGTTVSDALGHYAVLVPPGVQHYLVAFHASNVYGVTARDLVGA